MPLLTFDATDIRLRGQLKAAGWSLCVGAGISFGFLPSWSELSREVLNSSAVTSLDISDFATMVTRTGWSFDAWIQAAMNAYLARGGTIQAFTALVELALYRPLRAEAEKIGIEQSLVTAFANPHLLARDEFDRVLAFLESRSASVLQLANVLLRARERDALPAAIITFNYDTLLETITRMFQIRTHSAAVGKQMHPTAFLRRVTGPGPRPDNRVSVISWGHIWKLNLTGSQVLSPPIFVDDVGLTLEAIAEWMGVTDGQRRRSGKPQRRFTPATATSVAPSRTIDQIRAALS